MSVFSSQIASLLGGAGGSEAGGELRKMAIALLILDVLLGGGQGSGSQSSGSSSSDMLLAAWGPNRAARARPSA